MSILIKGMDMPEGNSVKSVMIYSDGTVYTGHVNDSNYSAVEVTTPHGRLIDADSLLWEEGQMAVIQDASYGRGREGMKNAIRNAPPVIEAEE